MKIILDKIVTVEYRASLDIAALLDGRGTTPEQAVAELFRQILSTNNSSIIIKGQTVNLHECIIVRIGEAV